MSIEIVSPSDRISPILSDLAKRRATILNVGSKGEFNKVIYRFINRHSFYRNFYCQVISVLAPLAELSGYSSVVRTVSSGRATMNMQPHGYSDMNAFEAAAAIRRAQGLE